MKLEVLKKEHYYHIYNRGINGGNIFSTADNKEYFLKLVSKYLTSKVAMFAYCLMDNHFHFIIRIDSEEKIVTQAFSNLFNAYAKAFNKQQNRTGSLFEKHFKRIETQSEEYLKQLIIYIHLNPKHHLNIDFKKYRFSSYQAIISKKETALKRNEVIQLFDDIDNFIFSHQQKNDLLTRKFTFE